MGRGGEPLGEEGEDAYLGYRLLHHDEGGSPDEGHEKKGKIGDYLASIHLKIVGDGITGCGQRQDCENPLAVLD